jgi:hypothetical protein
MEMCTCTTPPRRGQHPGGDVRLPKGESWLRIQGVSVLFLTIACDLQLSENKIFVCKNVVMKSETELNTSNTVEFLFYHVRY